VAETKLARSARTSALLQLCFYSEILEKIQGVTPERMHVALGDFSVESFEVARYIAYLRKVRNDFLKANQVLASTYPLIPSPQSFARSVTGSPSATNNDTSMIICRS
jgi:uncharacterized protein